MRTKMTGFVHRIAMAKASIFLSRAFVIILIFQYHIDPISATFFPLGSLSGSLSGSISGSKSESSSTSASGSGSISGSGSTSQSSSSSQSGSGSISGGLSGSISGSGSSSQSGSTSVSGSHDGGFSGSLSGSSSSSKSSSSSSSETSLGGSSGSLSGSGSLSHSSSSSLSGSISGGVGGSISGSGSSSQSSSSSLSGSGAGGVGGSISGSSSSSQSSSSSLSGSGSGGVGGSISGSGSSSQSSSSSLSGSGSGGVGGSSSGSSSSSQSSSSSLSGSGSGELSGSLSGSASSSQSSSSSLSGSISGGLGGSISQSSSSSQSNSNSLSGSSSGGLSGSLSGSGSSSQSSSSSFSGVGSGVQGGSISGSGSSSQSSSGSGSVSGSFSRSGSSSQSSSNSFSGSSSLGLSGSISRSGSSSHSSSSSSSESSSGVLSGSLSRSGSLSHSSSSSLSGSFSRSRSISGSTSIGETGRQGRHHRPDHRGGRVQPQRSGSNFVVENFHISTTFATSFSKMFNDWVNIAIGSFNHRMNEIRRGVDVELDWGLKRAEKEAITIKVSKMGHNNFRTITEAINSVNRFNGRRIIIFVAGGEYNEQILIKKTHYVTLYGDPNDMPTIIYGGNGPTCTVDAEYFTAVNIIFKSTGANGALGDLSVAVSITGDKASFYNCKLFGVQATLADIKGRHYFKDCFIQGYQDFIFGQARSLYEGCEVNSLAQDVKLVADNTVSISSFNKDSGFSFVSCKITGNANAFLNFALKATSRMIFAHSFIGAHLEPQGFDVQSVTGTNANFNFYGMYQCRGPGARVDGVNSFGTELQSGQAQPFLGKTFVHGTTWIISPPSLNFVLSKADSFSPR